MDQNIWLLWPTGENNLSISPGSLWYFVDNFRAQPINEPWTPPAWNYLGKSKKLRDFVAWMMQAPLVSQKAKQRIEELCGGDVQFLPFDNFRGKQYYAMNVLKTELVLDLKKCNGVRDSDTGKLLTLSSRQFRRQLPNNLAPIFKDENFTSEIYVTDRFAEMVITHGLTGLALADPSVDQLKNVIKRIDPNVVPGVIT